MFSAQKALALRQRIVRNFWCETGDVIHDAVNFDLFLANFIATVGNAPIADKTF